MSFEIENLDVNEAVNIKAYIDKVVTENGCTIITEDYPKGISPEKALQLLKEGNQRFVKDNYEEINSSTTRVYQIADKQKPFATFFSCSDSRDNPCIICNRGVGDIFEVSTAGETLYNNYTGNTDICKQIIESIEYAVESNIKCPLIVIMGHTNCGAVHSTYDYFIDPKNKIPAPEGTTFGTLYNSLINAYNQVPKHQEPLYDVMSYLQTIDIAKYLLTNSTIISDAVNNGSVMIVNGIYDVSNGVLTFYDTNGQKI